MPYSTYRFGTIEEGIDGEELLDAISDLAEDGIVGTEGQRRGIRRFHRDEEYVFVTFVKEVKDEYPALDENNEDVERTRFPRKTMNVVVYGDGKFIFESRKDVYSYDFFNFLNHRKDLDIETSLKEELSLEAMRKFYKESDKIRGIKVKNIGKKEPNPHITDEEIKELTEDAGGPTDSSEFSTGHANNDLKDAKVIHEGFAKYSDLPHIRAKDEEGDARELRECGRSGSLTQRNLAQKKRPTQLLGA